MVSVTEAEVRAALDAVVDPCSVVAGAPAGLVQMGLVRALELSEGEAGATIRVRIGVTEPGCLMGASFAAQARAQLERLDGVVRVEIELTTRTTGCRATSTATISAASTPCGQRGGQRSSAGAARLPGRDAAPGRGSPRLRRGTPPHLCVRRLPLSYSRHRPAA
jgi:metal-sulfur cluster biosynthetic enzyme